MYSHQGFEAEHRMKQKYSFDKAKKYLHIISDEIKLIIKRNKLPNRPEQFQFNRLRRMVREGKSHQDESGHFLRLILKRKYIRGYIRAKLDNVLMESEKT